MYFVSILFLLTLFRNLELKSDSWHVVLIVLETIFVGPLHTHLCFKDRFTEKHLKKYLSRGFMQSDVGTLSICVDSFYTSGNGFLHHAIVYQQSSPETDSLCCSHNTLAQITSHASDFLSTPLQTRISRPHSHPDHDAFVFGALLDSAFLSKLFKRFSPSRGIPTSTLPLPRVFALDGVLSRLAAELIWFFPSSTPMKRQLCRSIRVG